MRSGSVRTRTSSRCITICDERDRQLPAGRPGRPPRSPHGAMSAGLASVAGCRSNPTGRNICLGCWLLRRRGKFQLDRGGSVRMCGHQLGEQGAARTLPTGGRGTRQDLWAVRNATQGPLVTKAAWAFRAHRREHVQAIAVMLWFKLGSSKKQQAVAVLKRYPNRCRRGHPKNHGLPGCPQCVANAWERRRLRTSIPGQL
jgi:hypothetical protein